MKDLCQYGNRPEDEWEILPWIPDPRPPFKIWTKPEQIAPFFLIPHHPYAISLLLKISDGFRTEEFRRLGLIGSSEDWERLARGVIQEFEENNSGVDLFHFDSDEDVFCVYSQYIDDLMMLAKMIRAACADEKAMRTYLGKIEYIKLFWEARRRVNHRSSSMKWIPKMSGWPSAPSTSLQIAAPVTSLTFTTAPSRLRRSLRWRN